LLTITIANPQRNRYCAQPFAIGEAAARTGNEHRVAPDNKARAIEGRLLFRAIVPFFRAIAPVSDRRMSEAMRIFALAIVLKCFT
jgi:hypothetical protein